MIECDTSVLATVAVETARGSWHWECSSDIFSLILGGNQYLRPIAFLSCQILTGRKCLAFYILIPDLLQNHFKYSLERCMKFRSFGEEIFPERSTNLCRKIRKIPDTINREIFWRKKYKKTFSHTDNSMVCNDPVRFTSHRTHKKNIAASLLIFHIIFFFFESFPRQAARKEHTEPCSKEWAIKCLRRF